MPKQTVEDSLTLDILDLTRAGPLRPHAAGTSTWWIGDTRLGSVGWTVGAGLDAIRLDYTVGRPGGERSDRDVEVRLLRTASAVGGQRVWFACPGCGRRVRMLHLPLGSSLFRCRGCHGLTYRSQQSRLARFASMGQRLGRLRKAAERPGLSARRRFRLEAERAAILGRALRADPTFRPRAGRARRPARVTDSS